MPDCLPASGAGGGDPGRNRGHPRGPSGPAAFLGRPRGAYRRRTRDPGLERLPASLGAALDRLASDPVASGWFSPLALETYVGMKRAEIALAGDALDDGLCARYAGIY